MYALLEQVAAYIHASRREQVYLCQSEQVYVCESDHKEEEVAKAE